MKTYIVNTPKQKDRLKHVLNEFSDKHMFDVEVVTPIPASSPQVSLCRTFLECVRREKEKESEYFLFCEDDHTFTPAFSEEELDNRIRVAQKVGVELLTGGCFTVQSPTRLNENTFAVDDFGGTQFIVIFKNAYTKILKRCDADILDFWLGKILDIKIVMYPFISIQYNSGSSITWKGGIDMEGLFHSCETKFGNINNLHNLYNKYKYDNH